MWFALEYKISDSFKPFVYTESSLHACRAMVRKKKSCTIFLKYIHQSSYSCVNHFIILFVNFFVCIPFNIFRMVRVKEFPEGMMQSIKTYFVQHEKVPILLFCQIFSNIESFLSHLEQLLFDTLSIFNPESHIKKIFATC